VAAHARRHGSPAGHPSLAKLAQGTVCKILAEQDVKPHKERHYLEKRDPEFEPGMAEILCVYRQVAMLRAEAANPNSRSGIVRLTCRDQKARGRDAQSRRRDRIPPFASRLSSEGPQRRSRDEMALRVEGVVDGGMHAEETLSGSSRFEPLHLALSSPYRLMRVLRPIVAPKPLFVRTAQS
jgi:hypothetical protein